MLFTLSKILWWVLSPLSLIALVFLAGLAGILAGRAFDRDWPRRWGRRLPAAGAVIFSSIVFLPVDGWLLAPLEERFPQVTTPPQGVDGVIVLGGSVNPYESDRRGTVQVNWAFERVLAMATLAKRYPEAEIVFAGGTASLSTPEVREADQIRSLLDELGLLEARMVFERASRNTWENALYSRDQLAPRKTERWLLVTSAFHMPRAVGVFRALDWPVVAYPVDYQTYPGGGVPAFDPLGSLERVQLAAKEWIGLVYYRLRGWSYTLFPGPAATGEG